MSAVEPWLGWVTSVSAVEPLGGTVTLMITPLHRTQGEGLGDSGRYAYEKRLRVKVQE